MMLVTNYQILPSTVTEKNATKNILDGRKDRGKTVYPPSPFGERGYNYTYKRGDNIYIKYKRRDNVYIYIYQILEPVSLT
jgi:hypothetical protein